MWSLLITTPILVRIPIEYRRESTKLYDKQKHEKAVERIWRECGWIDDEEQHRKAMEIFMDGCTARVAEIAGEAECIVMTAPGDFLHTGSKLSLVAVTAVATSRIARKQGIATRLLAEAVAQESAAGAVISGLGVFDQGFYDRLGYGTAPYEHWISFDPSEIALEGKPRVAERISPDDWKEAHLGRINRRRGHGSVNLEPPEMSRGEMTWHKAGFGLGYRSEGKITHYLWMTSEDPESGPYEVQWVVYRDWDEFRELMQILYTQADQIQSVKMKEPPGIQLQDFLRTPMRMQEVTKGSKYEAVNRAIAYLQLRICNLETAVRALRLTNGTIELNLKLTDPITSYLEKSSLWGGCAGDFTLSLGQESSVKRGYKDGLPLLETDIGSFTRLWAGILPASGIAATGSLTGPKDLIDRLDEELLIPRPMADWDF